MHSTWSDSRTTAGLRLATLALALGLAVVAGAGRPAKGLAQEAVVIDHTTTDLGRIPDAWLAQARRLRLHYAHTSHGSQIVSGIERLARVDGRYAVAIQTGGAPALPDVANALRIYDGNNPETYITPELYWSEASGREKTRSVAGTGLFDVSMWSWCGQQSSNSERIVGEYLATMAGFEEAFPTMRFVLMTGHTDGGGATLARNNEVVRRFARDEGMVLFDFADIESYAPDGTPHPDTTDACDWCEEWCRLHPADCADLPSSCAHSHPFNCKRKAQAFWWMMARLAGWPGPEVEAPTPTLSPSPTSTAGAVPTDPTATAPSATATVSPAPSEPTPSPVGSETPTPYHAWLPWATSAGGG